MNELYFAMIATRPPGDPPAQRIEARSDETAQPAQPEGREPDSKADAPKR